jgi:hypothetical protein
MHINNYAMWLNVWLGFENKNEEFYRLILRDEITDSLIK